MRASGRSSAGQASAVGRDSPTPARPERFRLTGPSVGLDRRIHAFRGDIADVALAGRALTSYYVAPIERSCMVASVPLRGAPSADAPAVSELLLGEGFAMLEASDGWAWGSCAHDGYVGYLPVDALGVPSPPSHVVTARAALVFAAADIKARIVARWPMGARFAGHDDGDFVATTAGWVHRRHATSVALPASEPVAIAERLAGTPYRWGGRSGEGIDCSGLVQLALGLAGTAAPRDSDQQQVLGQALATGEPLRRGDLVFFPGHVGLMTDGERLVHANAHWMAVTIEPLADVTARLAATGIAEPVIARRRLVP